MESKKRFRSLSRRADFVELRATGHSIHINSWLLVNLRKTELSELRCGWTIPRQVGGAVVRNRLRRWGREFLREWAIEANLSLDMNLVFKRKEKGFYSAISHKEFDLALAKMVAKVERWGE